MSLRKSKRFDYNVKIILFGKTNKIIASASTVEADVKKKLKNI